MLFVMGKTTFRNTPPDAKPHYEHHMIDLFLKYCSCHVYKQYLYVLEECSNNILLSKSSWLKLLLDKSKK